jgi:hypothetical protein
LRNGTSTPLSIGERLFVEYQGEVVQASVKDVRKLADGNFEIGLVLSDMNHDGHERITMTKTDVERIILPDRGVINKVEPGDAIYMNSGIAAMVYSVGDTNRYIQEYLSGGGSALSPRYFTRIKSRFGIR